mgnify:CR=1 FL=1
MNDINLNHVFADLELQKSRVEAELHAYRMEAWKKLETALRIYRYMSTPASEFAVCWSPDLRWVSAVTAEGFLSTARYRGDQWHIPFSEANTCSIAPVFFSEDVGAIKASFASMFIDAKAERIRMRIEEKQKELKCEQEKVDHLTQERDKAVKVVGRTEAEIQAFRDEIAELRVSQARGAGEQVSRRAEG